MQEIVNKDNMKVVYKRYFYLLTEILKKGSVFSQDLAYEDVLSKELPAQFSIILKEALKYATDFLMQIKMTRKLWAKLITDEAFDKIKTLALS